MKTTAEAAEAAEATEAAEAAEAAEWSKAGRCIGEACHLWRPVIG
jgi:hypothetical protein